MNFLFSFFGKGGGGAPRLTCVEGRQLQTYTTQLLAGYHNNYIRKFQSVSSLTVVIHPPLLSALLTNSARFSDFTAVRMGLKSFVEVPPESHFPLENLPYGVFRLQSGSEARPAVAIGDHVLDLSIIASAGLFHGPILENSDCFNQVRISIYFAVLFLYVEMWWI